MNMLQRQVQLRQQYGMACTNSSSGCRLGAAISRARATPPRNDQVTSSTAAEAAANSSSSSRSWLDRAVNGVSGPPAWGTFLSSLFVGGALMGTLLDGIHSRTSLQVYDLGALHLGPLETSLLVPPLLGTWYLVMGLIICAADNLAATAIPSANMSSSSDVVVPRFAGGGYGGVALAYGLLAANLQLSATLYESGMAYSTIFVCLGATAAVCWKVMDGTLRGAVLAGVCMVGAPAVEVLMMAVWHTWHYTQPDLGGVFVSWVPWCYAGYVPVLTVLSRYLWRTAR